MRRTHRIILFAIALLALGTFLFGLLEVIGAFRR